MLIFVAKAILDNLTLEISHKEFSCQSSAVIISTQALTDSDTIRNHQDVVDLETISAHILKRHNVYPY